MLLCGLTVETMAMAARILSVSAYVKCIPSALQGPKSTWKRSIAAFASAEAYHSSAKPDKVINVAAIAGSLRKASFNRGLIRCAIEIARESIPDMAIDYVDIGNLPFVNTDLEVNNRFPESVEEFRAKVLQSDCILFASPEYNYSVTGPLKNAIDWGSRSPNVWADKPAAIMSAGGGFGGGRSQYHLRQIGVYIDLHFINKPELWINAFQSPLKFDSAGNLIDNNTKESVKALLLSLHAFTIRLQNSAGNLIDSDAKEHACIHS